MSEGSHQASVAEAGELSALLRRLQRELHDRSPAERERVLHEQVASRLDSLPRGEAGEIVAELLNRFPAWDDGRALAAGAKTPGTTDLRELADPSFLVTRLERMVPEINEDLRQALQDRLVGAGLVRVARGTSDVQPESLSKIRRKCELPDDANISLDRACELLCTLLDFGKSVNTTCLKRVQEDATRLGGEPTDLKKMFHDRFARYLTADRRTSLADVEQQSRYLSRLINELLFHVFSEATKRWFRSFLERIDPDQFEDAGGIGRYLTGGSAGGWKKWKSEFAEFREERLSSELWDEVVRSLLARMANQKP